MIFFSIFNVNLIIATMKAPKHLLNATDMNTCGDRVETDYVKILNDLASYGNQIFEQNPLFFIIQDCVNQRKTLFYPKVLLSNNFPQFDKSPGQYTSRACQVETKLVSK